MNHRENLHKYMCHRVINLQILKLILINGNFLKQIIFFRLKDKQSNVQPPIMEISNIKPMDTTNIK